jgi:hypothetical protein
MKNGFYKFQVSHSKGLYFPLENDRVIGVVSNAGMEFYNLDLGKFLQYFIYRKAEQTKQLLVLWNLMVLVKKIGQNYLSVMWYSVAWPKPANGSTLV